MEERFFSPVVQRCLITALPHMSMPPPALAKVSNFAESLLNSFVTTFKAESALHQSLSFSEVERGLHALFSADAIAEAEKEGAAALSTYVAAGSQLRRERAQLQAELEDFAIIGDDMAESTFLSEETELPITAALVQQRLVASGIVSEKSVDKSAAIYLSGVLEYAVTRLLISAAKSAQARGEAAEVTEADLTHALHTDMQATLLPFLTRALQQATPTSSVMSVSLLQAEDPPSNDTAPSFLLEAPVDGVLRQHSSMSTFVVEEYEPLASEPAEQEPNPPSSPDLSQLPPETSPSPPPARVLTPPLPFSLPAEPSTLVASELPSSTTTKHPPDKRETSVLLVAFGILALLTAFSIVTRFILHNTGVQL